MLVAHSSNHLHSFTGRCLRGELLRVMEEHGQMIAPEMKLGIKVTALSIISGGRDTVRGLVTLAHFCKGQGGRPWCGCKLRG